MQANLTVAERGSHAKISFPYKVLCSPHEYYGSSFTTFVEKECASRKQRWIYDIIRTGGASRYEQIFIDRPQWCLCVDKHHGKDVRYLVVFKDITLRTIRDLRDTHLLLLEDVYSTVATWIASRYKQRYYLFFHYMPSVFQLHLHVNANTEHINWDRAQQLSTVIANIRKNSQYYHHALILTKLCKTIRSADVHSRLPAHIALL